MRVAFALDCCDREAIARVATTEGITSENVHLVITSVENRSGRINILPKPIEWFTDNGPSFIAKDTESLLREIGSEQCYTPIRSPQSNGIAEALSIPNQYTPCFTRRRVSFCEKPSTTLSHELDVGAKWGPLRLPNS